MPRSGICCRWPPGIAISPIPIIAVVLILLSREATATSTGFLLFSKGIAGF